jgi:uncharacterized RDD family membrane protein YckC
MTEAAMPTADQPLPAAAAPRSPYGGFWTRFAAHVVDSFILWLASLCVAFVMFLALGSGSTEIATIILYVVLLFGGQFYHAFFVSSARMATPGKRLCGVYVTDLEGRRLGFGRALGRNLAAALSYLTLSIGFIMAGLDSRKQALHDKVAGTLVHRQPGSSSAGVVVAIVLVLFIGLFVLGVLASIAVSSFDDYAVRARANGIYYAMTANRESMRDYAEKNGAWPTTWAQVESAGGANPVTQLREDMKAYVEDFRLEPDGTMAAVLKIRGKAGQLRMTPKQTGSLVEWTCTASPEINWFVPPPCRAK